MTLQEIKTYPTNGKKKLIFTSGFGQDMLVFGRVVKKTSSIHQSVQYHPFNFRITSNHNCHHRQHLWHQQHQHISTYIDLFIISSNIMALTFHVIHQPKLPEQKTLRCTTMTYQQIHSGKSSSSSQGGLGRGCFALAFGTWHPNKVVMSLYVLRQPSGGLSQQP